MIKILVSQCLYGEKTVRYDGKYRQLDDPVFQKWKEEGRLIPVCPKVSGGLPVPRPPAERRGDKVINREGTDVTEEYLAGARDALQAAKQENAAFALLKEKSPSCGSRLIYDGSFERVLKEGSGVCAELLRKAGIRVFSEDEIPEAEEYLKSLKSEEKQ